MKFKKTLLAKGYINEDTPLYVWHHSNDTGVFRYVLEVGNSVSAIFDTCEEPIENYLSLVTKNLFCSEVMFVDV